MERAFERDSKDDTNGTFTTYFLNKNGALMSVFRLREGSDVPVEGVKKAGDTFNFFDGKLVSWRRTQDDVEQLEDPTAKGFSAKGQEMYDAAEKLPQASSRPAPTEPTVRSHHATRYQHIRQRHQP